MELAHLVRGACPRPLRTIIAPFDVQVGPTTSVEPDLLVARFTDIGEENLPVAPLLAVEVLSPSTRPYDLNTKKSAYERMGVASHWVVEPSELGAITVFDLVDGRYVQIAHVVGEEPFEARLPFPVTVVPARLRDGLRP